MAERHLQPVPQEDGGVGCPACGTILGECPTCALREREVAGLSDEIVSMAAKIRELKRNREREARAHEYWPIGERLFEIWKAATGKTKSRWDWKRFELVRPFLSPEEPEHFATEPGPPSTPFEECAAAIIGRTLYCFSTKRQNGTTRRFDEWERIFKDRGEYEDSRDRRPRDWRERVAKCDPGPLVPGPRRMKT